MASGSVPQAYVIAPNTMAEKDFKVSLETIPRADSQDGRKALLPFPPPSSKLEDRDSHSVLGGEGSSERKHVYRRGRTCRMDFNGFFAGCGFHRARSSD